MNVNGTVTARLERGPVSSGVEMKTLAVNVIENAEKQIAFEGGSPAIAPMDQVRKPRLLLGSTRRRC